MTNNNDGNNWDYQETYNRLIEAKSDIELLIIWLGLQQQKTPLVDGNIQAELLDIAGKLNKTAMVLTPTKYSIRYSGDELL